METKLGDVTATGTATVSWPEDENSVSVALSITPERWSLDLPEAEEPQEQEAQGPQESE
jgi:hypothetical protein